MGNAIHVSWPRVFAKRVQIEIVEGMGQDVEETNPDENAAQEEQPLSPSMASLSSLGESFEINHTRVSFEVVGSRFTEHTRELV
jgi:hypothetical protein